MNPARAAFDRAITFLRAGDGVMAEQLCRGALADFPGEPNLMSLLGAALNRQGRGQEAEPLLRRALEDEPGYAKGQEELGRSLLLQGRFDEAIERLRKALELDSKLQSAQLTLVHALTESGRADQADEMMQAYLRADPARQQISQAAEHHRAGRLEEAEAIYREILRRDPRNLEALRLLALIAMNAEHYGQAEQLLKRAVEIAPDFLAAWVDLSRAQLERQDLPAAHASIERAAELSPHSANVRIHAANVQARSGLHDQAIETYRRAIELNPELPAGYLGLGNVLKTVGRQAEAIEAYRRATVLRPESSEAWWSLSNLKTFRFEDSEIETMARQLEAPALTDESRVQFSFALAKASEDRSDYARAFEHYGRGNRRRRAMENYDPVQTEVINDRIIQVFDAGLLARCAGRGHPDPAPIFIVGLPRSGSTLIEQILASHSEVDATHELPEVGRLIQRMNRDRKDRVAYPEAVLDFDDEAWAAFGRSYIEQTRQYRRDAPRFIDKNPNNFANIGLLSLALPNARFINTRRHPLDTCLSCYKQLFARGQPFTYDLVELGEYYLQYVRMMAHWHAVLPGRVLDVHYEAVVADQVGETRRLLEFCGLPWEDACLRYYETERAIRTASSEQVRRPIYTDSVGLWRNYRLELAELIEILQPVLPRGGSEAGIALSFD
ncbi:MAG TPA: sulfotransferase [Steroidobacteraceae bacterium]|nr:sulfotransferase [Steroidobacteraceae bacterium]